MFGLITGLANVILNGAVGFVWIVLLGFTICLAEITGLCVAVSFGGVAILKGVAAVIEEAVLVAETGLIAPTPLTDVTVLAGLSVITLIWTGETLGTIALAIFLSPPVLNNRLLCMRLVFMIAAVVEVPQSVHISLYSASLRPHFRQNGIYSHLTF